MAMLRQMMIHGPGSGPRVGAGAGARLLRCVAAAPCQAGALRPRTLCYSSPAPSKFGGRTTTIEMAASCSRSSSSISSRSMFRSVDWRGLQGKRSLSSKPEHQWPSESQKKPLTRIPQVLGVLKKTKHENIYTIPNILTFSRLVAAPVVGWLVLHDYHAWAFGLFAYAGITDLVDGYIARRWNLQTVVGTVIDPMADKTLMTILTVCLAVKGALPIWLAVIILGRDIGLAISAIYYRWISLPPPKTFSRYWDFSLPSAEVRPTTISKYNTALQLALIGGTTALPLITADLSIAMTGMQYLVATTTIWSGASYIYSKDAVKILNQNESKTTDETETKKEEESTPK